MADDKLNKVQAFDFGAAYQRARYLTAAGKRDPHGEAEGVVTHPDSLDTYNHASTVILCKDIADQLTKTFPDWHWAVQPQEFGGVVNIYNLNLHSEYAYTLKMQDLDDPKVRSRMVYVAAQEILRRFNMPRRLNREVLAEAPRDVRGNCIPDISDLHDKKQKQNAEIALGLATGQMEVVTDDHGHQYLKVNW